MNVKRDLIVVVTMALVVLMAPTVALADTIDRTDRAAVRAAYEQRYQPIVDRLTFPDNPWTGSVTECDAGTLPSSVRDDLMAGVNFLRAMAGTAAAVRDPAADGDAQAATTRHWSSMVASKSDVFQDHPRGHADRTLDVAAGGEDLRERYGAADDAAVGQHPADSQPNYHIASPHRTIWLEPFGPPRRSPARLILWKPGRAWLEGRHCHRPWLVNRLGLAAMTGAARLTAALHIPSWPPM